MRKRRKVTEDKLRAAARKRWLLYGDGWGIEEGPRELRETTIAPLADPEGNEACGSKSAS